MNTTTNSSKNNFRQALLALGAGTQWPESTIPTNIQQAFTQPGWSYITQRSHEYGLTPEWVVSQFKPAIRENPSLLIDLLDEAGEYPGVQFEHIISQANAPHLANNPDNIILAPSDGFNQSLGAQDMTHHQVAERINDFHQYQADALGSADISLNGANNFDFMHLFNDLKPMFATIYVRKYIPRDLYDRVTSALWRIIHRLPKIQNETERKDILQDISNLVSDLGTHGSFYAAVIMFVLITHVPWAAKLLAIVGLASLAKALINKIDSIIDGLSKKDSFAGWVARKLQLGVKTIKAIATTVDNIIQSIWHAIETGAAWVGEGIAFAVRHAQPLARKAAMYAKDLVVTAYRESVSTLKNIWNAGWSFIKSMGNRLAMA
jgi:hypothetical protein